MAHRALAAGSLLALWALALSTGCASGRAAGRGPATPAAEASPSGTQTAVPVAGPVRQGLFRVRFRGVDGRGRMRLTLRAAPTGDFSLDASDTFGRRVWSFESRSGSSLLLDHRAGEYCRLEGDIVFRAVALSDLSASTLPRVLFGELPLAPSPDVELPRSGEIEYHSEDGRRWSARYEEGRLATWTLWEDDAPLVWWMRDDDGGILSHSDGAQALWKTVAVESVEQPLAPLEIPEGYTVGECDGDDLS